MVRWSAARPRHTLPPGKTRYPFYRRLGRPHGRSGQAENLILTGIRSRTVQPVVSHYTDWATPPLEEEKNLLITHVNILYTYAACHESIFPATFNLLFSVSNVVLSFIFIRNYICNRPYPERRSVILEYFSLIIINMNKMDSLTFRWPCIVINSYNKTNQTHRFADSKLSANLYDVYHCCVYSEKLLMMDRGTVWNI